MIGAALASIVIPAYALVLVLSIVGIRSSQRSYEVTAAATRPSSTVVAR